MLISIIVCFSIALGFLLFGYFASKKIETHNESNLWVAITKNIVDPKQSYLPQFRKVAVNARYLTTVTIIDSADGVNIPRDPDVQMNEYPELEFLYFPDTDTAIDWIETYLKKEETKVGEGDSKTYRRIQDLQYHFLTMKSTKAVART